MSYRDHIRMDEAAAWTFYLYGYSFTLNATKTVSSITLPNDVQRRGTGDEPAAHGDASPCRCPRRRPGSLR